MKTKEIENYSLQLKDFRKTEKEITNDPNEEKVKKEELVKSLEVSRYNTTIKMIGLIAKM